MDFFFWGISMATIEQSAHTGPVSLRLAFCAQCKLLAARAERGLPVDVRSLRNLLSLYRELVNTEKVA